jgi:protein ImuB
VSAEAARLGLHAGQKATDAMALVPELTTADADPEADAEALTALIDWCVRFSPAVAADAPDGLFLDISGVSHLWGGEAELMGDFRDRLTANGLAFRLAIADTPGAAWALAHYGRDGTIAPPGGQAELLKPLPPAALRLDPDAAAQIARLGLRRLEQILGLPRAPFGRRFGAAALDRLDQALGRSAEALAFRRPPTPWMARLAFFEPISAPEDMARVTTDVTARLCARLDAEGHGARRFEIAFHRVDGQALPLTVGLALPGRDAKRIARLFHPKLETVDPGFGIECVTICAYEVEPVSGRQDPARGRPGPGGRGRVGPAGRPPRQPPGRRARLARRPGGKPRPGTGRRPRSPPRRAGNRGPALGPRGASPRAPVPPPRAAGGRHQPVARRAAAALPLARSALRRGPRRGARTYRRRVVEARDRRRLGPRRPRLLPRGGRRGARFWVFRAGLYGDPAAPPKWWLHGLFA